MVNRRKRMQSKLKLLNISSNDLIGQRFNGFDIRDQLLTRGIEAELGTFWTSDSNKDWSFNLFPGRTTRVVAELVRGVEVITGHQNRFQFWSKAIIDEPRFQAADVVHLQIIHDHFMKFENIKLIAEQKPTIWTWHDLWPITGHCIFPERCPRLQDGCGNCPDLAAPLPVFRDRTAAEFARKSQLIGDLDIDIHVTTDWMVSKVAPYLRSKRPRLHKIPFGIDGSIFRQRDGGAVREKLGIGDDAFVVFARATDDPRKGFNPLVGALDALAEYSKVVLLTVQGKGLVAAQTKHLKTYEFGWTNDQDQLADLMSACDLFCMPSTGESFGMMALEAMSCGKPVVSVTGTATAEIIGNEALEVNGEFLEGELFELLAWASKHRDSLTQMGIQAAERVAEKFSMDSYLNDLSELYRSVASR